MGSPRIWSLVINTPLNNKRISAVKIWKLHKIYIIIKITIFSLQISLVKRSFKLLNDIKIGTQTASWCRNRLLRSVLNFFWVCLSFHKSLITFASISYHINTIETCHSTSHKIICSIYSFRKQSSNARFKNRLLKQQPPIKCCWRKKEQAYERART